MQCPQCHKENKAGRKFCSACGSALPLPCSHCGFENEPDDQFCGGCGKAIAPSSPPPAESSQPANPKHWTPHHLAERILAEQTTIATRADTDGERKTITALFADVVGFTTLTQSLDPEDARQLIDPALHLMMNAVHRYDGYVAQSLGDGIFALFGAPLAHEDHAQRALYAALRMQEEMHHYADRLRLERGVPLQIRVGISTGEVVLRSIRKDDLHVDYVPVGHSTNLASRMESLATPGSIIVSHHTYKLIEGYFECKFLGEAQVKGVDQPVSIYEVLKAGPLRTRLQVAAHRGLTRFVGRHDEMEQMQRALVQAQAGHGQIVGVMGEPGLGKSRLFYEFVGTCSRPSLLVLQAYSVSHGKASPYLPLIELLKSYFQLQPQDDERTRREKTGGKVLMLDRNLEDTLPYLFALLGIADSQVSLQQMDPQIRRRRTFDALKRLFLRESLNQPLLLIFEDLHWIDTETQGFLDTLSESIASARILLLVNYRPEYRHEWGAKTYYTQLRLAPFGKAEAEEFLDVLLDDTVGATGRSPLQDLKRLILEKTEGTPFFIEEVVQTLAEEGVLSGERGGYQVTQHASTQHVLTLHIPTTVQGVLAARIDRLASEEKALLQQLAVIGREFPLSLIKHVITQSEDELYRLLSVLQHKEFLYEQPAFPEVEYIFKHALTQEVAYGSVLQERRKALHEQTARAIEQLFHNQLEEHYSELAYHYTRSGNAEKAVEYLHLAGLQAVQRSANTEAISHLTTALELLKTLPNTPERIQQELMLQIALGAPLIAAKGWAAQETVRVYIRAQELCQQAGEAPQLFSVLVGLWFVYYSRVEVQTIHNLSQQCLNLAQSKQDSALLLEAHAIRGWTLYILGEFVPTREHFAQGRALYDSQQHRSLASLYGGFDPGVSCDAYTAYVLWLLGYPEQALKKIHAAITLVQELAHPFSLAMALNWATISHQFRREVLMTQKQAEAAIALSTEQGFPFCVAWGTILRGWALAEGGQREEGIAQIRQGIAAWQATGVEVWQPYFLALLAEGYRESEQAEDGLAVLTEAIATVESTGERWYEAELYRLRGELMLQKQLKVESQKLKVSDPQPLTPDTQAEAEECFLKAIATAQQQQAKSLELRAVMSLVRLRQQQVAQFESRNTDHATRTTQHGPRTKLNETHQMLSDVYNWFTEGFDTKDLQEARALLEELRQ